MKSRTKTQRPSLSQLAKRWSFFGRGERPAFSPRRSRLSRFEQLEDRRVLTTNITAFNFATGAFTFTGDQLAANEVDNVVFSRTAGGLLQHNLVTNGAFTYASNQDFDPTTGGVQTYTIGSGTADLLTINLLGGNDNVTFDETNGVILDDTTTQISANFDGGTGSDTFTLSVSGFPSNLWHITGANSGDLELPATAAFTNTENLTSAANSDDTFTFSAGGSLAGNINGGAGGTDNVNISAKAGANTVNLATATISGGVLGGTLTSIESFTGDNAADTLTGADVANIWNITSSNSGNFTAGPGFAGFPNLTGGTNTDNFVFSNAVGVTGAINGAGGTDTLNYAAYIAANPVTVNLATGVSTNVTGGISNIENATGGAGNDTLIGNAGPNTLIGNAGNNQLTDGLGNDNLSAGAGDDTYFLTPGSADVITDTGGNDTVDFNAASSAITINMDSGAVQVVNAGGDTVQLVGQIENFVGSAFADSVTMAPLAVARSVTGNNPTVTPGDLLTYVSAATVTKNITGIGAGNIVQAGFGTVTYTGIERVGTSGGGVLNDSIAINATLSDGFATGADGAPNSLRLDRDATGVLLQIYFDGNTGDANPPVLISSQIYANVGTITVTGNGDNDTLIVDHGGASVATSFINRSITFDAGSQTGGVGDALVITGNPGAAAARETYLVGATQDAGTWVIDQDGNRGPGVTVAGNGDEMVVSFTGLEPADSDTPAAIFDVIMNTVANQATIENGAVLPGGQSVRVTDSNGTFETFQFANKTTARIMGNSGLDEFQFNATTNAAGLTAFQFYGHLAPDVPAPPFPVDDNLPDYFSISATLAGVTTSLFGQGGDDRFFSDNNPLSAFDTPVFHLDDFAGNLEIDGGANGPNGDQIAIYDGLSAAVVGDNATLTSTTLSGAATGTIGYVSVEFFTYNMTGNQDQLAILSTAAGTTYLINTMEESDTVTIGNQSGDLTVNANGSLSSDGGSLDAILGSIILMPDDDDDGAVGDNDILNVDDSASGSLSGSASISNIGLVIITDPSGETYEGDVTRLANFAGVAPGVNIDYFHSSTDGTFNGSTPDSRLEQLNVFTSTGTDTIAVNVTTAVDTTRVDMHTGNDNSTMTINGDGLSADNIFHGSAGNDNFILNITASIGDASFVPVTSLEIHGDDPATDSANRDRLTVNDFSGAARQLDYLFLNTQGDLNIAPNPADTNAGLFGTNLPGGVVQVRTMETYIFNDDDDDNDTVRVFGATDDGTIGGPNPASDILTVALLRNDTSALVFRDGAPYLGTDPVTIAGSLPGVAGGGFGPDLLIRGMDAAAGITLDGNGIPDPGGDRAVVYAKSENDLVDPVAEAATYDIFGFGDGVLQPGNGTGEAYDDITVDDTGVTTDNNVDGLLTRVNINTGSFVQNLPADPSQQSALIVNGGDEADPDGTGVADDFDVTTSTNFNIQVNGNLPNLTKDPNTGAPQGDRLNVTITGAIDVFSDNAAPPNVTVKGAASTFGVKFSSIEIAAFSPSNGVVNLIGDNNDPNVDQNDYFRVRGGDFRFDPQLPVNGQNQFVLQISGNWDPASGSADFSPPIYFSGVQRINASGGEISGHDVLGNGIAVEEDTGVDAYDVTPWADNTPRNWGIESYWNEGDPTADGGLEATPANVDLLVFGGVAGVSDRIVIAPSGYENGQVYSNNGATNTPIAVVNYILNSNIIINANDDTLGDADSLLLLGTNQGNGPVLIGNDRFVMNLYDTAGPGTELVQVTNPINGNTIYNLQATTNIQTLRVEGLSGDDTFILSGNLFDGLDSLVVDGGIGNDSLTLDNSNGPSNYLGGVTFLGGTGIDSLRFQGSQTANSATYTVGPNPDEGYVVHGYNSFPERVSFTGLEPIVDVVQSASLVINATNGDNAINYSGPGPNTNGVVTGLVSIDAFETYEFANKTVLTINALAGSDTINLNNPTTPTGLTGTITINGGDPTAGSDTLIYNDSSDVTFEPTGNDSGNISGSGPTVAFATIEGVTLNGLGGRNTITYQAPTGGPGNRLIFTPGDTVNSGSVTGRMRWPSGNALVPMNFVNYRVGSSLAFINGAANAGGHVDTLEFYGNDIENQFNVNGNGGVGSVQMFDPTGGGTTRSVLVTTAGITTLNVFGLAGDDTFNVNGPLPYNDVTLSGGDPSASDTANITGDNTAITVQLANPAIPEPGIIGSQVTGGGLGTINLPGVEIVNANYGNGGLTALGSPGVDNFFVSNMKPVRTTIQIAGANTVLNASDNNGGTLTVDGGQGAGGQNTLTFQNNPIGQNYTVTSTTVTEGGLHPVNYTRFSSLTVIAGAGNETLTVDSSTAPVLIPVTFDGGIGFDTLILSGGTASSDVYTPGPQPGSGSSVMVFTSGGGGTQRVYFQNLEPVVDLVASPLTVVADDGSNAIDYRIGRNNANTADDATRGLVSIDNHEFVNFSNKTTLTINALAGDDVINIANFGTPTGLTGITVNGGNPGGSDVLVITGTAATEAFEYAPTGTAAGTVVIPGPDVAFTETESVVLDGGSSANNDTLVVRTPAGVDITTLTPGANLDSGTFTVTSTVNSPTTPSLAFKALGGGPFIQLLSGGAGTREDIFIYQGTASDDTFTVTTANGGTVILGARKEVQAPGANNLILQGLDGDDRFGIPGDHPFAGGLRVEGGNPSASDVVNFTGSATVANLLTVDFGANTVVEAGSGVVSLSSVEILNVLAATHSLTVRATGGNDTLSATPTGANEATLVLTGSNPTVGSTPVVNGSNIGTLSVDMFTGSDTLTVNGTQAGEAITVTGLLVTVGALETINYTTTESLRVLAQAGDDTITVTPAAGITMFIDGGDPIGSTPGDRLVVNPPAGAFSVEPGPENDEGGMNFAAAARLSWDKIEALTINGGAGPGLIVGTGADDDITIIARDATTHAGTNGIRDFTVTVNAGPEILFIDTAALNVDAGAGDDDIVLRAPAPNGADWNVQLTIAGGPPSAGTGGQGDVFEMETPGVAADTVVFTPTGSDTGTLFLDQTAGNDSLISLVNTFTIAGLSYTSSPGGVEQVVYDGEADNDNLTILGTAGSNTIVHTPGPANDAGDVRVDNLLPFSYQNVGAAAVFTINGNGGSPDTLIAQGTGSNDTFGVNAAGTVTLNSRLPILRTALSNLTLDGFDGNDTFNILGSHPYTGGILASGGNPSASDVLNFTGTAAITVDHATDTISSGNPVVYDGIEHVNIIGATFALTVNETTADDRFDVQPTSSGAGNFKIFTTGSIVKTSPQFVYSGVNNAAFTVNGLAGFDIVHLLGNESADVITSTASTVTRAGGTVTIGTNLERLDVDSFGGDDNITLTTFSALAAVVRAGDGDDTVFGTTNADLIYGGFGNDILVGGGAADTIYGEDGNDRFGDAASGNAVADDAGDDRFFGGDGSDTFVWDPGDNNDLIEGGGGSSDVLIFNGSAAVGDTFTLTAVGTRLLAARLQGAVSLDVADVENVNLNGLALADTFTVNDLYPTAVQVVNVDFGAGDGAIDAVTINGRDVSDQVNITPVAGVVEVTGLRYDVNVSSAGSGVDTFTFNGNNGNDNIVSPLDASLTALFASASFTLNGGLGDDYVAGYGTLNGNEGNDTLVGGSEAQTINGGDGNDQIFGGAGIDNLNGGAGEDVFVPGFDGAIDVVDGGADFDTILVQGTSANNYIDLTQDSPTQIRYNVQFVNGGTGVIPGAGTETDTLASGTVEEVKVLAGSGDDRIRVTQSDSLIANAQQALTLRFTIDAGAPGASDRLTVIDDGFGDTTIQRIGGIAGNGSFQIGLMAPVVYFDTEYAELLPIDPVTGATGGDGTGDGVPDGRLYVFKQDPYESNNSRLQATFLGSNSAINVDPTIDPATDGVFGLPGDEDWYRIVAQSTGDLDIRVFFAQYAGYTDTNGIARPGLPGDGNLDIALYDGDATPTLIAGTGTFGTNDTNDNERIRIPAVAGQTYYLRVKGAALGNLLSPAVNVYNVSVINTPTPTPFDLELDDIIGVASVDAAPAPTATVFDATAVASFTLNSTVANFYQGKDIVFTSGNLIGQRRRISAYDQVNQRFTVSAAFTAAPAVGSTFQIESADTGRSQLDNITRDTTPTIFLRIPNVVNNGGAAALDDVPNNGSIPQNTSLDSAPDNFLPIPFNSQNTLIATSAGFRVPIFLTENGTSDLGAPNNVLAGYAQPVDPVNRPGVFSFTFGQTGSFITDLASFMSAGTSNTTSFFISARTEIIDPSQTTNAQGYGAYAQSLEILVDTQVPPVFFGLPNVSDDGLLPDSDTGIDANPHTLDDEYTSDTTPGFFGQAEADTVIRLYVDFPSNPDGSGDGIFNPAVDFQVGFTVAQPFDGTNQYADGYWQIDAINYDLNAAPFPIGGPRTFFVTAEDVAGNIGPTPPASIQIFIDTQGPQVTGLFINSTTQFLAINGANQLFSFSSTSPNIVSAPTAVTGLAGGFTLQALDILPSAFGSFNKGTLFGLATNGAGLGRVYSIVPGTGAATAVGGTFSLAVGTGYGFDFNPTNDLLRITSSNNAANSNVSFNITTGTATSQTNLSSAGIAGSAYDRNDADPTSATTLYGIDFSTDNLVRQGDINGFPTGPGGGVITTIGSLGVNTTQNVGFDIVEGTNIAYAALDVGGDSGLYQINLATGAADLVGVIGNGTATFIGLTAVAPYDLFDPKPSTDGPTPLANSLVISFRDLPPRTAAFLQEALKLDVADTPGLYQVKGDYNGIIPIQQIIVTNQPPQIGQPALATVELVFRLPGFDGVFNTSDDIGAPLPDDRYTLTVLDNIIDLAGNHLDGESNASEPQEFPSFPTGDGVPGGNFLARFTIDSRPELGVYAAGSAWIDINGNNKFDPDNADFTNRDITYVYGYTSDDLFAGKFVSVNDPLSGNVRFDKLGAYGRVGTSTFRWMIDTDNDGVADVNVLDPSNINGLPVAGNFASFAGDEVGVFTGSRWHFDTDHNWSVDTSIGWTAGGYGVVGDFDGDGIDDLASYENDTWSFDLSSIGPAGPVAALNNGALGTGVNGTIDRVFKFGFIGAGERPVVADMNQDGIEDVGLWVPAREGVTPRPGSEWYFLVSGVIGNDTVPGGGGFVNPPLGANIGPTITGTGDPTPGSYKAVGDPLNSYNINTTPGQVYGTGGYLNGRIVVDPLFPNSNIVRFQPVPFGNDLYMQFGDEFAMPLVGNFDPPVTSGTVTNTLNTGIHNTFDVTDDGLVNAQDILALVNYIIEHGFGSVPTSGIGSVFYDVNNDLLINAFDILGVINYMIAQYQAQDLSGGEGEGEGADAFFADLGAGPAGEDDDLLDLLAAGQ